MCIEEGVRAHLPLASEVLLLLLLLLLLFLLLSLSSLYFFFFLVLLLEFFRSKELYFSTECSCFCLFRLLPIPGGFPSYPDSRVLPHVTAVFNDATCAFTVYLKTLSGAYVI